MGDSITFSLPSEKNASYAEFGAFRGMNYEIMRIDTFEEYTSIVDSLGKL